MATLTPNYNLEKPDATDEFKDFRQSYNSNMDIIDQNLGGGGGGGGGHTIIDENGTSMTQRSGLHFTGNVEVTDDSVNDETDVDIPYEVVHLTQAQYDALPNTKLTDGKVYCITDIPAFGDNLVFPVCYSTEEREIGCWTDGKPLYQKTINFGALPNNTSKSVAHNISNLGYIVNTQCVAENPTSHIYLPIPFSHRSAIGNQIQLEVSSTDVSIYTALDRTPFSNCYITLQYTKTTDTAGSGNWNPSGVPSVHYDSTEKVIGTWFGETLYEKTWSGLSASVTQNAWNTINSVTVSNLKDVINATIYRTGGSGALTSVGVRSFSADNSGTHLQIIPLESQTINYVMMQYTKTA